MSCLFTAFMIMLRFYLFHYDLSLIIDHGYVLQRCLNKDRFFIMLTSYIRLCPIYTLYQFLNDVRIADR
jgi:hypothetical protein